MILLIAACGEETSAVVFDTEIDGGAPNIDAKTPDAGLHQEDGGEDASPPNIDASIDIADLAESDATISDVGIIDTGCNTSEFLTTSSRTLREVASAKNELFCDPNIVTTLTAFDALGMTVSSDLNASTLGYRSVDLVLVLRKPFKLLWNTFGAGEGRLTAVVNYRTGTEDGGLPKISSCRVTEGEVTLNQLPGNEGDVLSGRFSFTSFISLGGATCETMTGEFSTVIQLSDAQE